MMRACFCACRVQWKFVQLESGAEQGSEVGQNLFEKADQSVHESQETRQNSLAQPSSEIRPGVVEKAL